jgi:hypothetical protein
MQFHLNFSLFLLCNENVYIFGLINWILVLWLDMAKTECLAQHRIKVCLLCKVSFFVGEDDHLLLVKLTVPLLHSWFSVVISGT